MVSRLNPLFKVCPEMNASLREVWTCSHVCVVENVIGMMGVCVRVEVCGNVSKGPPLGYPFPDVIRDKLHHTCVLALEISCQTTYDSS